MCVVVAVVCVCDVRVVVRRVCFGCVASNGVSVSVLPLSLLLLLFMLVV